MKSLMAIGAHVTLICPLPGSDAHETITIEHVQATPKESPDNFKPTFVANIKYILRRHILLPDPDIRWANRVIRRLKEIDLSQYDIVFTSSPPESIHKVGYILSKKHNLKWISDFRDLWLVDPLMDQRRRSLRRMVETSIAKRWLRSADSLICVNSIIASEIENISAKAVSVVEPFAIVNAEPKALDPALIHIGHTGSFSLSDPNRKIEDLLAFMQSAIAKNPQIHLHIAGRLLRDEVEYINNSPFSDKITFHGMLSPNETQALQLSMSALILVLSPQSLAIPGKYYEYRACGKPIYAIGGSSQALKDLVLAGNIETLLLSSTLPSIRPTPSNGKKMQNDLRQIIKRIL